MAEVNTTVPIMPPTAWALLAGEMTSDTTPTDVGGMVPPPKPPSTLTARNISIFGAKADPSIETRTISTPTRATGRRPKESASGPTATIETANAANEAVFNCPETATETSKSVAISTRSAGTITIAVWVLRMVRESTK